MTPSNSKFQNFLKVLVASLGKPTRITVIGLGTIISAIFPTTTFIMIPASIITAITMAWADINDPEFIDTVLKNSNEKKKEKDYLKIYVNQFHEVLKTEINPAIKDELESIQKNINKIIELNSNGNTSNYTFIQDSLKDIMLRVINLTRQETRARNYMNKITKESIVEEINTLEIDSKKISDKIAKQEYEKAIKLKREQLTLIKDIERKIERIDSYITKIKSSLDNTYANLTKESLKDEQIGIDETDILVESLKSITSDIDLYESRTMDIEEEIKKAETKEKNTQKALAKT